MGSVNLRRILGAAAAVIVGLVFIFNNNYVAGAGQVIRILIDNREIKSDVAPMLVNNRTMVPLRAISEGLGMQVEWDQVNQTVKISAPKSGATAYAPNHSDRITIMGNAVASASQLKALLHQRNPQAPELVDLYLQIGEEYGIRGDIAFCQAAKETGWWKYGGLVKDTQNNYCGLGATGTAATGSEDLNGADPAKVHYEAGVHGAIFATPADGVEAQIQHLYAYGCNRPLPPEKTLIDPRFSKVQKGSAATWGDLNGKWAVPGSGYGQSILNDYLRPALLINDTGIDNTCQLQIDNELLRIEIENLIFISGNSITAQAN